MSETTSSPSINPPPMHRRLIAMFYDFSVFFIIATIISAIMSYLLNKKGLTIEPNSPLSYSIFFMNLFAGFLYYQWFSIHRSQTLGMSVWKIRITNLSGQPVSYLQVLIRYISLIAILFSGYLFGSIILSTSHMASIGVALLFFAASLSLSYFNPHKLVLHELISRTQLVDLR